MADENQQPAALATSVREQDLDAHYRGFFTCFNGQRFHEAHDVLEKLWLRERSGPYGAFYQGLIQLAGAFVHLQKNRAAPALTLLKLAQAKLADYPPVCLSLELPPVLDLIDQWLIRLQPPPPPRCADLLLQNAPRLHLR
jgi:predicted metal-dependent hydrolase